MFAVFVIIMDGIHSPIVLYPVCIAFIFLVSTVIAFKKEKLGGIILFLEGFLITVAYPIISSNLPVNSIIYVLTTKGIPPLISGSLFMLYYFQYTNLTNIENGESCNDR